MLTTLWTHDSEKHRLENTVCYSLVNLTQQPWPSFSSLLFFSISLLFFVFRFPLLFLCVFPLFSRDSRGSAKRKTLAFLGSNPSFFQKSKDWRVREIDTSWLKLTPRLKITSTSAERQKRSQNLAPVLVIISGNSLVFYRKIITSTGFYRYCAPGASAPVVVINESPINANFRSLAHRNSSDFCDLRLRCPSRTPEIASDFRDLAFRFKGAMDPKVASDLRFRVAVSGPKPLSFCGISGDLAPSTWKSLAITIVLFWCAKFRRMSETPTTTTSQKSIAIRLQFV